MKRILVTAGPVYGRLDDNKLVSNRSRGVWAAKFARRLADRGHQVTLLVPDIMVRPLATLGVPLPDLRATGELHLLRHSGFDDYKVKCESAAATHDSAVMAAAVVNWIPEKPYDGKMPTVGYGVGERINVPFYLAPHVIDRMRAINPKLTLIGCTMLVGSTDETLIDAAYGVVLRAKCNVVLANDLANGLRRKLLVYPDRTVVEYDDDWDRLYDSLQDVIEDGHWHTEELAEWDFDQMVKLADSWAEARSLFDDVAQKFQPRFAWRTKDETFGSLLTRGPGGFLVSSRWKGPLPMPAVVVQNIDPENRAVLVAKRSEEGDPAPRATMNAPLLVRMWQKYRPAAVLHLHEQLPGAPSVPYAPPGTDRDNLRDIPAPAFNIEGHGFIACLDANLNWMKPDDG